MLTPAPIMCTFVPKVFLSFFFFFFFWERWCDEGGEASWLHLGLSFLGVTCSLSSLLSLCPEFQHQPTWTWLLFLLLGNCWSRSSVHANSLRLVSNILSFVIVLSGVREWVKRTVFAAEGLFSWSIPVKVSFSERSFLPVHISSGSSGQP